jgi:hypothetical protein
VFLASAFRCVKRRCKSRARDSGKEEGDTDSAEAPENLNDSNHSSQSDIVIDVNQADINNHLCQSDIECKAVAPGSAVSTVECSTGSTIEASTIESRLSTLESKFLHASDQKSLWSAFILGAFFLLNAAWIAFADLDGVGPRNSADSAVIAEEADFFNRNPEVAARFRKVRNHHE